MCNILIFPLSHIVLYCCNKYCNISIYCNIVASLIHRNTDSTYTPVSTEPVPYVFLLWCCWHLAPPGE